jgi:membrane associated rhomboid family serine protease
MLPLRDNIRSISFPVVNWILIAINILVFFLEVSLPEQQLNRLIMTWGMTPAHLHLSDPTYLLSAPQPLLTLITHMFLHGGWVHVISNLWFLFIFGDNVEDRMGSGRYLAFYLLGGIAAAALQAFVSPNSTIPSVGASGAIAAVLGAYVVLFPGARVYTLIPLFILPWFVEIQAVFYLGYWFVTQLFSGVANLGMPESVNAGGVAWWAHIGGFLFGLALHRLFTPRRHPAYSRQYPDEYWPW